MDVNRYQDIHHEKQSARMKKTNSINKTQVIHLHKQNMFVLLYHEIDIHADVIELVMHYMMM